MEELTENAVKNARFTEMAESLSNMRTAGESDVSLICDNKEFLAHKLILKTASPYFVTMFNSELKEAKSGQVTFDEMEAETLESILDFIYLGNVVSIKSEEQYKKVLIASHLMQMDKLFEHCCKALGNMLRLDNFFELLVVSEKYELDILRKSVKTFWFENYDKLLEKDDFYGLSACELKALITYLKSENQSLDVIMKGVVKWFQYDRVQREVCVGELLKCFSGKLLSKQCLTQLLQNDELVQSSKIVLNELKELSISIFMSYNGIVNTFPQVWGGKLTYFSQNYTFKVFSPTPCLEGSSKLRVISEQPVECNGMQQFDLNKRLWLPLQHPNLLSNYIRQYDRMCQVKHQIYMFSAHSEDENGMYNLKNNTLFQLRNPQSIVRSFCTICYFKEKFYSFGENEISSSVSYIRPDGDKWVEAKELVFGVGNFPTALTSSNFMYVIDKNPKSGEELVVQFNSNPAGGVSWKVIGIGNEGLLPSQFFISNDTLNAFHYSQTECTHLEYNHDSQTFYAKRKYNWHCPLNASLPLSKYQNPKYPFVFFSKKDDHFTIPHLQLDLQTAKWTVLPDPQGECQLPNSTELEPIYYV